MLWGINLSFPRLCPSIRQVVYVLLTRAPLVSDIAILLPFDLHVLGLPLAFILSQDQTLRSKRVRSLFNLNNYSKKRKILPARMQKGKYVSIINSELLRNGQSPRC